MVSLCKVSSRTLDNLRHAPQRLLFHIGGLPLSHKTVHLGSVGDVLIQKGPSHWRAFPYLFAFSCANCLIISQEHF